ncbi:arginine--tRNA ligase [uncultured Eubacterium sp.]|uniref:arginine--tRNA ligase n=1 Tax=uncultured Eubacterium sp. TaxID=165185 RepID=UPI002594AE1C|nr:arginine--tRNA ligase [uncultured Eubacterium sp.]
MKKLLELITEEFEKAFEQNEYDKKLGKVVVSNRPDLCQYQCNGAMAGAKLYHKAPIMIANQVVESLQENEMFESVEAVMPGFINIKLNSEFVAKYLNDMKEADKYGCENKAPETIVIDYGGANVAKPLHVGHLRSAVIGESVKRIERFMGNKVISDVHLGDWGLQMGLIITELECRKPDLVYFDESYTGEYPEEAPFTISELEEIYPCASAKSKVDEEFKEKAHQATLKLQSGYAPYTAIWKHIMKVSVEDLKKNYGNLNVDFDLWKGESDAQPYIPGLIQDLIDKKLAYESQGALVVDISKEDDTKELPPCIVRKSDGAALYATSDLATIIQREQDYKPNHYIYVADKRQELHFTQVFRVSKKANIVDENTKMEFLGFGTMNGKDGKPFKTRDGGVMRLESLIAQINKAVYDKIMENRTVSEEEANNTAKIVGLAALKYGDLSNQASKDYIFDIDRFASFEGNTGPYILYTIVRIKSILEKYKAESGNADVNLPVINTDNGSQMQLMLEVAKFNEIIENAAEELAPHKICSYVYDLSNAFNRFYHETKILAEEDQTKKAGYIALINLTINVLEQCIDLLGFSAPDRM